MPKLKTVVLIFDNDDQFPVEYGDDDNWVYDVADSEQQDETPVGDELYADLCEARTQKMAVDLRLGISLRRQEE